jgi:hypothetical protein
VEATPAVAQQAVDAGVATGGTVAQPVAVSEQDAAAMDANREAAPVPAEPSVGREADNAPSAYADLCRQTAAGRSNSASRPTADEGVALSPLTATANTPSPASSEASPVAAPARAANAADTRAARPATSVFSPAAASRGEPAPPPAVPTVTVGARPPAPSADVAPPSLATHQPTGSGGADAAMAAGAEHVVPANSPATDSPDVPAAETSRNGQADSAAGSWRQQIKLAAEQLRKDMDSGTMDDQQRARCQVYLSLLLLAEEDPERAVAALEDFDDQQLEFWRQTVLGMSVLLDSEELPKLRHRVDSATAHFYTGVSSLSVLGPLRLLNLAFCTKVNGYGDFVECSDYGLEPGKPVLLYVEVENYTVESVDAETTQSGWTPGTARRDRTAAGRTPKYATELHGRYEILDANQRAVVSRTLPIGRDECRNRRRDYYISYVVYLPEHIQPGPYTLELTIEDKKGAKFGNAVIDFQVK